jgi:glycosyltransferase involved in cell wall biosynthesis
MMVQLLADPADTVIGRSCAPAPFASPRFVPARKPLWPPFGRNARYAAGVTATLKSLCPARVEVHNRADLALLLARSLPQTPFALFVHNDPLRMRGARRPAERAELLARMQVICVSAWLRDRFMNGVATAAAQPALHLPNAVDIAALPPRLPAAVREKTVLFVGRVVADKGADAFVRAWGVVGPSLSGWRASIIGADRFTADSPDTPFTRALRPEAVRHGVAMTGYLPHAEVLRTMARASIVVAPSRWQEPFGLTALEALASGAALICSAKGGLPEVAGEAALYADPDHPGALEAAIRLLANDTARRAALAEAGLARAQGFDARVIRARLAALRGRAVESAEEAVLDQVA